MIEVGRICMKTAGREAGRFCVVLDVLEDGFVLVTGPKAATTVKRRKCSIHHVEPTPETVKIKKNATDHEVLSAYKAAGIYKKLEVKEPSAKDVEKAAAAEKKRATGPKPKSQKAEEKAEEKPKEAPIEKKAEKPEPKKAKAEKPKAVKKPAAKPVAKKPVKKTTKKAAPKKK
ncbi:MAG: 50S ribosomal protein L14e [Candidatus Aenigmarchaeota archaeon]|nr:50S ribosomal protein L14e [Candidatus Aenigmarchaeota archaeon]